MYNLIKFHFVLFVLLLSTNDLSAQQRIKKSQPFPCDSATFAPLISSYMDLISKDMKCFFSDKRFENYNRIYIIDEPPATVGYISLDYDEVEIDLYFSNRRVISVADFGLLGDINTNKRRKKMLYPLKIRSFNLKCNGKLFFDSDAWSKTGKFIFPENW